MPAGINGILDFLRDSTWKILIIVGTFSVFAAFILLTRIYQWVSSMSFMLGVILIVVGIALHFESFTWKVPSIDGFATLLIYVSPILIAAAIVTAFFAVPREILVTPFYGSSVSAVDEHGSPFGYLITGPAENRLEFIAMLLERPSASFAAPLLFTGLGLLALGCIIKLVRDTF